MTQSNLLPAERGLNNVGKKYFSIIDLASYLNVKPRAVRYWVAKAEIPFYKFGRNVRFEIEKIRRWEKSKEVNCFRNQYN